MTRKRYQKKMYALATRLMNGNSETGKVLKNTRRLKMSNGLWQNGNPAPSSYSEAWAMLKPSRQMLGMQ